MTDSLAELSKGALNDLAGVFAAMPENAVDGLIEAKADERAVLNGRDVTAQVRAAGLPVNVVGGAMVKKLDHLPAGQRKALLAQSLLEGEGKRMRHVKLRPGKALDETALGGLIAAAYDDMRRRLGSRQGGTESASRSFRSAPKARFRNP